MVVGLIHSQVGSLKKQYNFKIIYISSDIYIYTLLYVINKLSITLVSALLLPLTIVTDMNLFYKSSYYFGERHDAELMKADTYSR